MINLPQTEKRNYLDTLLNTLPIAINPEGENNPIIESSSILTDKTGIENLKWGWTGGFDCFQFLSATIYRLITGSNDLEAILRHAQIPDFRDSYQVVIPQELDYIFYCKGSNMQPVHAGLMVSETEVMSKWGIMSGPFIHKIEDVPGCYGSRAFFVRSNTNLQKLL